MFSFFKSKLPTSSKKLRLPALPNEIWYLVFSYLPLEDQFNANLICKSWKGIFDKNGFIANFSSISKKEIQKLISSSSWIKSADVVMEKPRYSNETRWITICALDFTNRKDDVLNEIIPPPAYPVESKGLPVDFKQMPSYKNYIITTWLKITNLTQEKMNSICDNGLSLDHTIFLAYINEISDIILYRELAEKNNFFVLFFTFNKALADKINSSLLYVPKEEQEDLAEFFKDVKEAREARRYVDKALPIFYKYLIDKGIGIAKSIENKNNVTSR